MKRKVDIKLKLYKQDLERVYSVKFLGAWFDSRLTWREHIGKMVGRCKRVVNVMRGISGQEWGADRLALKAISISMIRSIMDYGCLVYGSANKSNLIKLENSVPSPKNMLWGMSNISGYSSPSRDGGNAITDKTTTVNSILLGKLKWAE